jgi:Tol biopolymer transport system component
MDSDGGNIRQITDLADVGGRSDWSPDGRTLTFYAGPRGNRDIYLIDADGSNLRKLTEGGDSLAASFSPDGGWLAFISYRDGDNEIYIMRLDGSEVTQLTYNNRPDWQPRWGE